MSNLKESLATIMEIDGALACSVVDYESGMSLGEDGGGLDLELAAAGNSEVVKAKLKTMASLGVKGALEDILITLEKQYHIIRPMVSQKGLFIYVVLNKSKSNLALARRKIINVESEMTV
ncbi:MAG: hypothetical protein L3J53_08080 [Proteobacteria bacterium]|nr:hypothetical protein [Pseudomonadota bacterium]